MEFEKRLTRLEEQIATIMAMRGDGGRHRTRVLELWNRLSREDQDERLGRIERGETATRAGSAGHALLEAHRHE